MLSMRVYSFTAACNRACRYWLSISARCQRYTPAMHTLSRQRQVLDFASKLSPAPRPWSTAVTRTASYPSRVQHATRGRTMCRAASDTTDDLVPGVCTNRCLQFLTGDIVSLAKTAQGASCNSIDSGAIIILRVAALYGSRLMDRQHHVPIP
jgi:hypothetical protein